jgi:hypothetical protein
MKIIGQTKDGFLLEATKDELAILARIPYSGSFENNEDLRSTSFDRDILKIGTTIDLDKLQTRLTQLYYFYRNKELKAIKQKVALLSAILEPLDDIVYPPVPVVIEEKEDTTTTAE